MADWSALTRGFQQGASFTQDFRERRQLEKAREFALKKLGREDFDADMSAKAGADNLQAMFGVETDLYQHDGLKDPLAFRLMDWFKKRRAKPQPIVGVGEPEPLPDQEPQAFADGGDVESEDDKVRERARQNRERRPGSVQQQTERVQGADRSAPRRSALQRTADALSEPQRRANAALDRVVSRADDAAGRFMSRPTADTGRLGKVGRAIGRGGALSALAGTALTTATTPTEQYRERFGLQTDDPSLLGDIGVRALGAASDLGNVLTLGHAGRFYRDLQGGEEQPTAMPALPEEPPQDMGVDAGIGASMAARSTALDRAGGADPMTVDFSQMQEVAPEEVPNMATEDWVQYRIQALQSAARKGIDPTTAQEQVNDQITRMQQKGFLNYAQQGLMLQQAGNIRGAMAAFRAAYQYMPNGYDVEFGTLNHNGRQVIVGFGRDEKTGQRVPGTELIMDPERVGVMIENFTNPQAFRMWTKDWRDFNQSQRQYEEVTKPLAEMQGSAALTNAEANLARAQADLTAAANPSAGYKQSDMRGDAAVFREAPGLQQMLLEDPEQAQYLLNVMGRIKQARPNIPPDAVASAVMNAVKQGNLEQWLQRLGVPGQASQGTQATQATAPTAAAPRRSALSTSPAAAAPAAPAQRPEGFPDAVWNNALRDNGGDVRRAAAALSAYNQ